VWDSTSSSAFTRDLSGSREKDVGVGLTRNTCLKPFQHNVRMRETDRHS
jgi:hypothetical protein